MVYIEIAAIIIFSIVSYLSLKKLLLAKFKKLDDDYLIMLTSALDSKSKELDIKQSTSLHSAYLDLKKENKLYLSRMNGDISKQLEELSDNVKNKRII